jgi:hypothetical protein
MKEEKLSVLLIGESERSFSHIEGRLEKSGCQCRFAKSYEEAHESLRNSNFDIVLSVIHPRDNAISSIADSLAGRPASFFYALPVEESCWWLPALRHGERCIGAPALRPSEFSMELDEVVAEIRAKRSLGRNAAPAPIPEEVPVAKRARKTHA